MKRFLLLLFVSTFLINVGYCQCTDATKEKVENLKNAIPYPKYNIDDVVYIAFIKDPTKATNNFKDEDIVVRKVKIVDMMLYNSIGGPEYTDGLYLDSPLQEFPIKWKYQFIDTTISNPKYSDRSNFFDEESFCDTPIEAKKVLKEQLSNQF